MVEAWIQYDAHKKSQPLPDFAAWPWEHADDLDHMLGKLGFKTGIITGYLSWTFSTVAIGDLRRCAVVNHAIPGTQRCLGRLEGTSELRSWLPNRGTNWYERLSAGGALTPEEPLLLRRSVQCEAPADWYLEDGSGRALAIIKAARHSVDSVVGYAYVGNVPDFMSTFMQREFPGLLQ